MKPQRLSHSIPYVLGVLLLAIGSGCDFEPGSWGPMGQSEFKRTIARQMALESSDTLDVLTKSGSVTVAGAEVADCNIVAKVVARAPTEGEAQELAEQVEIVVESTGSTLKVRSREPNLTNNRSISVSYTITVPRRMNVKCDSSYGSLNVSKIEGRLNGRSSNGSIKVEDIQGVTDIDTSYGSIQCRNVTGQTITLRSNNGSIHAKDLRGSVDAETDYGSITCEDSSAGDLRLKSGNGRIGISNASFGVCDARSSYGAIACSNLRGDSVELHSGNGSVELADAQAKDLGLSSSYGSVRATQIAVPNLRASSGNGSVRVACSSAAPTDLKAQVKSSYGSVEFTPPPGFSGEVYMSTDYGALRTALPLTMSGEISKTRITGRVGEGTGKIHLESGSGSVELK